ncbi:MAG: GAF domain-containing protein [Actinobacteria bacterium]|nr:GAF domain-containing protein [Actinomycetota bacterium]
MSNSLKTKRLYKKSLKNGEIKRLNTLKDAISKINHLLLHVKKEGELYQKVCDILIKTGEYVFICIGLLDSQKNKINGIAFAGKEDGYLSLMNNPVVMTAETGKILVVNDIATDTFFKPWRSEALYRDYRAMAAIPLIYNKKIIGNLNVYSGVENSFKNQEIKFLNEVANDIAIGIKSIRYEKELERNYINTKRALYETINSFALISERRDSYTAGHQKRVAALTSAIAKAMKLDSNITEGIYFISILHDLGKMCIPLSILSKPACLSKAEIMLIQSHCNEGYDILKNIEFPWPIAETILQHHERINGSGYPYGLKDKDILLEAKILAVADTIEAMSSHRPYRPAIGLNKALKEIAKNKGILYDGLTVDVCIDLFKNKKFKF